MKNIFCLTIGLTIVGLLAQLCPAQDTAQDTAQDSEQSDSDILKSALKSGDPILVYVYDSI